MRSGKLSTLRSVLPVIMSLGLAGCVATGQNGVLNAADLDAAAASFAAAPGKPDAALTSAEPVIERGSPMAPAAPVAETGPEATMPEVKVSAFAPLPPISRGANVDALIAKYAAHYGMREEFLRKVVKRESTFNPRAFNNGHWGLMQIKHQTARGMGYRGSAQGLFDAETNLIYGARYLRGALLVAGGNEAYADKLYQSGYYYHAKRQGLLDETGLGRDRVRRRGKH